MSRQSRRTFLKVVAGTAAAVGSGMVGGGVARAGWFGRGGNESEWVAVGAFEELPDGERVPIETAVRVADGKQLKKLKLMVLRRGDNLYAMSLRCTHMGCKVNLEEDGTYACPCHGATFDGLGNVTGKRARKPLAWYATRVAEDGQAQVDLEVSVDPPEPAVVAPPEK